MELFLDRCQYFDHFYESVDVPKRPCLLNIIRQRYLADREKKFSSSFVTFLQSKFKSYNQDSLLKSFKSRTQTTAKEAAAVLDLLSNFSSDENYLKAYQQDFALFQHTVGKLTSFCSVFYHLMMSTCFDFFRFIFNYSFRGYKAEQWIS